MRTLIVLTALVAAATAQISSSTVAKAKQGCDYGVPAAPTPNKLGWVKVECSKVPPAVKQAALTDAAEFLGASQLAGSFGAETYAVHGKVNGKCCSQRVSRIAGTQNGQHRYRASPGDLCCYDACPAFMVKC